MIKVRVESEIYVSTRPVDARKSIDRPAILVSEFFG